MIKSTFITEFQITKEESLAITSLVQDNFPEVNYEGRDYFKQAPHYRIPVKANDTLIGHVGLDYRTMGLDSSSIKVLGLIDICVDSQHRNRGIGETLLFKI